MLKALISKPSLISRVSMWSDFSTSEDLVCMLQYTRLEYLDIGISPDILPDLAKYLPRFRALSELWICIRESLSAESEALLLSGICGCHSLRKIYQAGTYSFSDSFKGGLKPSSIMQILISHSRTLQFFHAHIHKPLQQIYEHGITEVLKVVRSDNYNLRMLALTTSVEHDTCKELKQQLRKAIETTEQEIEQLAIVVGCHECASTSHLKMISTLENFN